MKCKYIIHLPGGETIELSTNFELLTNNEELDKLFNEYLSLEDTESKSEKIAEIATVLKPKIPKTNGNRLHSLIEKSSSIENLYETMNNLIIDSGSYSNIEAAIRGYVKNTKPKNSKKTTLEELLEKLNKPRKKDYFSAQGIAGVIGSTSIAEQRDRVYHENTLNAAQGLPSLVSSNLLTVLNAFKNADKTNAKSKNLYGFNISSDTKAWSSDGAVLFQLNDDKALFLGLFKSAAINADPELLKVILEDINKKVKPKVSIDITPEEFFNGDIKSKKLPEFERLMAVSNKYKIQKEISSIISLVGLAIKPENNDSLVRAMKILFGVISPKEYGYAKIDKLIAEELANKEASEYSKSLLSKNIPFDDAMDVNRDLHYESNTIINANSILSEVSLYNDIMKFSVTLEGGKEIDIFAVPTAVYPRPNGVYVTGTYKKPDGTIGSVSQEFKDNKQITIRKRSNEIDPTTVLNILPVTKAESTLVTGSPIPHEFIRKYIRKGDLLGEEVVVGVYPGKIQVKSKDKLGTRDIFYKNIRTYRSAELFREISLLEGSDKAINLSETMPVKDGNLLSSGDYFKFDKALLKTLPNSKDLPESKLWTRIIYTDDENVYYYISDKDKTSYVIKPIKKSLIKTGVRNTYGEFVISEKDLIEKEKELISKSEASMSSFKDINKAKEDDYFFYKEGDNYIYGKVVEGNKVIIGLSNRTISTLEAIKENPELTFLTSRSIQSSFHYYTERANSPYITFKPESEQTDLDVRGYYVIPKRINGIPVDKDTLKLTTYTQRLNVGRFITDLKYMKADEEDVTNEFLKIHDKNNLIPFVKKVSKDSNSYEKNFSSLHQIINFSKLSTEEKKSINSIHKGIYVRLYNGQNLGKDIYRVEQVNSDTGEVTLQVNKQSKNGEILTTEIVTTIETLIAPDKTDGSIADLYVQKNDHKLGTLERAADKTIKASERALTNQSINTLADRIKDIISSDTMNNVTVEIVPHKENFESRQKAKIETSEVAGEWKTRILISDTVGQKEDLLHEFLHVFLTPLKYKYPEVYYELVSTVTGDKELSAIESEEQFVKTLVDFIDFDNLEMFSNLETFVEGMKLAYHSSLEKMLESKKLSTDEYTKITDRLTDINIETPEDVLDLLNTPLISLFGIISVSEEHSMYNYGMLMTESTLRTWMDQEGYNLKCV